MKAGIHPPYIVAKVICACGNTFETRSTKELIKLEICGACHPFFTGQQKLVDTAGRVERFQKRFQATGGQTLVRKAVKPTRIKKIESVGAVAKKRVLTTAPKAGDKDKKDKSPAKTPAKKAA